MCLKGELRICVTGPGQTRDFLVPADLPSVYPDVPEGILFSFGGMP